MALSDYTAPRKKIDLGGGNSIEVRGLGMEDVSFLVSVHSDDMDAVVEMFRPNKTSSEKITPESIVKKAQEDDGMIAGLLQTFPLLAANIIAVACDEPDQLSSARRLPLPKQTEALIEIARLTFEDAEGFKKFVGNVAAVLRSATPAAPQTGGGKKTKKTKSTGSTD